MPAKRLAVGFGGGHGRLGFLRRVTHALASVPTPQKAVVLGRALLLARRRLAEKRQRFASAGGGGPVATCTNTRGGPRVAERVPNP